MTEFPLLSLTPLTIGSGICWNKVEHYKAMIKDEQRVRPKLAFFSNETSMFYCSNGVRSKTFKTWKLLHINRNVV